MRWEKPLFVHLAIPPAAVEARLPRGLTLDPEVGESLVSLVALACVGPAPRLIERTPLRALVRYRQLNVRTYVKGPLGRGLYFLDTRVDRFWPMLARGLGLPYHRDHELAYDADELGVALRAGGIAIKGLPSPAFAQRVDRESPAGSLLERYLSYATLPGTDGLLYMVRVEHPHWRVRSVDIDPESRIDLGDLGAGRITMAHLGETMDEVTIEEVKPAGEQRGLRGRLGRAALSLVGAAA